MNLPGAEAALTTTVIGLVCRRGRLLVLHLSIGISGWFIGRQMISTHRRGPLRRVAALLGRVAVALLGRVTLLVTALGRVTAIAVSKSQVSKTRITNHGMQSSKARRSPEFREIDRKYAIASRG